jgi:hypothetical protein
MKLVLSLTFLNFFNPTQGRKMISHKRIFLITCMYCGQICLSPSRLNLCEGTDKLRPLRILGVQWAQDFSFTDESSLKLIIIRNDRFCSPLRPEIWPNLKNLCTSLRARKQLQKIVSCVALIWSTTSSVYNWSISTPSSHILDKVDCYGPILPLVAALQKFSSIW